MTNSSIAEFRRSVIDDLDLQNCIWALKPDETFAARLCEIAHARGFEITIEQIHTLLSNERQQWFLRKL